MIYFSLILILGTSFITSSAFGTNFKNQFGLVRQQQQQYITPFYKLNVAVTTTRGGGTGTFNNNHDTSLLLSTSSTSTENNDSDIFITDYITKDNLALLSERGRIAISNLIQHDKEYKAQQHIYTNWPDAGIDDTNKSALCEQLADLDSSYPGGLANYISKARTLLKESADGTNPFTDYEATVPTGETLSYTDSTSTDASSSTMSYEEAENIGSNACAGCVFVLVAGGLGERLGYSGIKISLETELCTNTVYIEYYIKYIQALTQLARKIKNDTTITIPLVIMTSGDTDELTRKLLIDNNYYGLDSNIITIVTQDKVAALQDGNGGLAIEDNNRWIIQTKPHGHGDVHHLLYREGLVDNWEKSGKTHIIFIQDTNALVINGILPSLGVSVTNGFHLNSLCIPRLAGEAAGAIARLNHKTDPTKSLVINVEYNQLDPLLRTQGDCTGDVADPTTGYSPFPGNANNLIIELSAYSTTVRGIDQGIVDEFVNPKYKDTTRTIFKKPTRLECMMQDIPKLFQKEYNNANIGFTNLDRWFSFSPAKNSLEAGQEAVVGGSTAPGTMSSAESDLYIQNQRKLQYIINNDGTNNNNDNIPVSEYNDYITIAGIPVTPGPRIVIEPSFGITRKEYQEKIIGPISITQRSSIVLSGQNILIKKLIVDGALHINAGPETYITIDGLNIKNLGWVLEELQPDIDYPEEVRIRGYTMNKIETASYTINEPGHFIINESGEINKVK